MPKFLFIGDPKHGGEGPNFITAFGHSFNRETPTIVEEALAIRKLTAHTHFARVKEDAVEPVANEPVEVAPVELAPQAQPQAETAAVGVEPAAAEPPPESTSPPAKPPAEELGAAPAA